MHFAEPQIMCLQDKNIKTQITTFKKKMIKKVLDY